MSRILNTLSSEVKASVLNHDGYKVALAEMNVLRMWQIVEEVALGRAAVTVYTILTRVLSLRQNGSYQEYLKAFRDLVTDLTAHGSSEELLRKMWNTLFVMGLDRDQFAVKLNEIMGKREWPDFEELARELLVFTESREQLKRAEGTIMGGLDPGVIEANVVYGEGKVCWNCKRTGHTNTACRRPSVECTKCKKKGHLAEFCEQRRELMAKGEKKGSKPKGKDIARKRVLKGAEEDDASDDAGAMYADAMYVNWNEDPEDGEEIPAW